MKNSLNAREKFCAVLVSILIIGFTTPSFGFDGDSSTVLKSLQLQYDKIRSGKIVFKRDYHSFFFTDEHHAKLELDYSFLPESQDKFIFWLSGTIKNPFHFEDILLNDTLYQVNCEKKEIHYSRMTSAEYQENWMNEFCPFAFGIFPQRIQDILGLSDHYEFRDSVIHGDTCFAITYKGKDNNDKVDSTFIRWIFSKNDYSHNSFYQASSGYSGNTSQISQQCLSGEYSESFDVSLAKKIHDRLFSLITDSGYVLKLPPTPQSGLKENKIKKGDIFPVQNFENMDNEQVDISTFAGKETVLDLSYMGCSYCEQSIPTVSRLYKKYKDSSVNFFYIDPYDKKEKEIFKRYSKKIHIDYPILFSDRETIGELGLAGYPTFIFLDKEMKVQYIFTGYGKGFVDGVLETNIKNILKEEN